MPQSRNWRVASDFVPNGKGSIFNSLVDISVAARKRAMRMNEGEIAKLGSRNKLLEKYANVTRHHQEKVMQRINHTLSELQAYKQVVDREFKAHHFDTLTWGYDYSTARHDPQRLQRFVHETKIYHSGFVKSNFRRHIEQQKLLMHPNYLKSQEHERRVARIKKLTPVFDIPRTERSVTLILQDFQRHKQELERRRRRPPLYLTMRGSEGEEGEDEGEEEREEGEEGAEGVEDREEGKEGEETQHRLPSSPMISRREKTFKTSLEI